MSKFQNTLASNLWDESLDGGFSECGETDWISGWNCLIRNYILTEDMYGFVSVKEFETYEDAQKAFHDIWDAYEEWSYDSFVFGNSTI